MNSMPKAQRPNCVQGDRPCRGHHEMRDALRVIGAEDVVGVALLGERQRAPFLGEQARAHRGGAIFRIGGQLAMFETVPRKSSPFIDAAMR
ncbi:MAG: hypothetical protein WDM81_13600 [Rhizomicrobium sp.]